MERVCSAHLVLVLCLGLFLGIWCQDDSGANSTAVYIVILKQPPLAHLYGQEMRRKSHGSKHGSTSRLIRAHHPRTAPRHDRRMRPSIAQAHDSLLRRAFRGQTYLKLYSYHYLINGFAVLVTQDQADKLARRREVANVVLDYSVGTATTHTPEFLGLPGGAWLQEGGHETAGEGIVIGIIDTGIDPTHPSFSAGTPERPYPVPPHFHGVCEVTPDFPSGSCNRKLIGARHFAASAITRGLLNSNQDYVSPFDGDGHGTHTASIAAGNHGVPVVVYGHHYGSASGMAPRAHIAVYKALYQRFGGFAADVVAAIDQVLTAAQDGVDIISLSVTSDGRPPRTAAYFNPIDMALLSAVKTGIFVVQAAGNRGPSSQSVASYSPWLFSIGAASHDRVYSNSIILGNNVTLPGAGLAPGTDKDKMYTLVLAVDALSNGTSITDDIYVGECQDSRSLDQDLIRGNILICSYTINFVIGTSTIKQALEVAKNLSAAGVVLYLDPFVMSFQLNPTPMTMPGIIIVSPDDSKILLEYYNSSVARDTKKFQFGAVASIGGGLKANYSNTAPKVMFYSSRGPDPEDGAYNNADILKPDLVAPGHLVWAAWSSLGSGSLEFLGEKFALISGTSMAAPHVAGIAALIKQKYPDFSPAAIASALSTSAILNNNNNEPILAQRANLNPDLIISESPATPFDMGCGSVNATAALDPGLIFDISFDDYMSFLCGINGSTLVVYNYTGQTCLAYNSTISGVDLNLPSITIAKLNNSRTVRRFVKNIAKDEYYNVGWSNPYGVSLEVSPPHFSIASGKTQTLTFSFEATMNHSTSSFGRIGLYGSNGHVINIPVSVIIKINDSKTASP